MANKTIQCWCCNNNAKTCLLFAGIQIIYGMMYLIYSIVTWSIRFYPRVKSSLETYYAFGQPALIVIGGMGLILIVLACTDFSSKCFVGFFWTLLELILLTITLYRLSEMVNNRSYEKHHENNLGILTADYFVSSATIFGEIFAIAATIAYLCRQAEEESQDGMADEATKIKTINWNPVMLASQPQLIYVTQPQKVATPGYLPAYPYTYHNNSYYDMGDALMLSMVVSSAMPGVYDPYSEGIFMF